jgi:hypothetical protein
MDASILRYPETVYSGPKHKFCFFLPVEGLRNAPKHSQTSFWVKWSRMDASQLRYPETVYSGSGHKFYILLPVRNTPKHHSWSNGVEWMLHIFDTPKQCIQAWNTSVASLYLSKVSEMLRSTPKHHFGSNGVEWMLHNFGIPKQCIQSRNTSFASFTCPMLVKCSETLPNFIFRPMEMFHDFGTQNSAFWLGRKFCIFYLLKVCEILRNTPKNHFGSNGDVSQLWYPETVYSGPKHKFCIFLPVEGLRNAPKHSQTSFWLK